MKKINAYNITIKISVDAKGYKSKSITGLAIAKDKEKASELAIEIVKQNIKVPGEFKLPIKYEVKKVVSVPTTFVVDESILKK